MIEEEQIPQQIRNVIFGYGSQYLIECLYVTEREGYKRAIHIARPKPKGERPEEEKERDIKNVEYYGKRMNALHKLLCEFMDIEEDIPFNL